MSTSKVTLSELTDICVGIYETELGEIASNIPEGQLRDEWFSWCCGKVVDAVQDVMTEYPSLFGHDAKLELDNVSDGEALCKLTYCHQDMCEMMGLTLFIDNDFNRFKRDFMAPDVASRHRDWKSFYADFANGDRQCATAWFRYAFRRELWNVWGRHQAEEDLVEEARDRAEQWGYIPTYWEHRIQTGRYAGDLLTAEWVPTDELPDGVYMRVPCKLSLRAMNGALLRCDIVDLSHSDGIWGPYALMTCTDVPQRFLADPLFTDEID